MQITKASLDALVDLARTSLTAATDIAAVEAVRVAYFGKKGELTALLKQLGSLSAEERPAMGQLINQTKESISQLIEERQTSLQSNQFAAQLAKETIDVTLPGIGMNSGGWHPLSLTLQHIKEFFTQLGFRIEEGREIETEEYNFTKLNTPENHPARAMHDTFYFGDGRLLRSHTSPVQIHVLEKTKPPVRIIAPGRVYRCDRDATHSPMFHQVEGLIVDENITFANLKGILQLFLQFFFDRDDFEMRLRPSYFPFTEPSAEVDIRFPGNDRWLEILGCGMVHPNVLSNVGIDSSRYSGFAFGMGVERLAMLRYGVDDLRLFYANDLRFLAEFN